MKTPLPHSLIVFTALLFTLTIKAQWTQVGSGTNPMHSFGVSNNYIHALCTDAAGNLYAAGEFSDSLGNTIVEKWDGANWSQLGSQPYNQGHGGLIYALCTDDAGNVYAAGQITDADNSVCVSKWDGTSWTQLGVGQSMGVPGGAAIQINALCADADNNIYAGGNIQNGVSDGSLVVKWNGTTWASIGTGDDFNDYINTLVADGNTIYASGDFTNDTVIDGVAIGDSYVSKWNGSNWTTVGTPITHGPTLAMVIDASHNIYVGGGFTDAQSEQYVAKWNGSTWSELGGYTLYYPSGVRAANPGSIYAVYEDPSGYIYAGGAFSNPSGSTMLDKYTSTSWVDSTIIQGGEIFAMAGHGSQIYIAGAIGNSSQNEVVLTNVPPTGVVNIPAVSCKLYPNPTSGIYTIALGATTTTVITLTDITGQTLEAWQTDNETQITCNISRYAAGIYLLHIAGTNGLESVIKLIKE